MWCLGVGVGFDDAVCVGVSAVERIGNKHDRQILAVA